MLFCTSTYNELYNLLFPDISIDGLHHITQSALNLSQAISQKRRAQVLEIQEISQTRLLCQCNKKLLIALAEQEFSFECTENGDG